MIDLVNNTDGKQDAYWWKFMQVDGVRVSVVLFKSHVSCEDI